jgi:hypothetical protein
MTDYCALTKLHLKNCPECFELIRREIITQETARAGATKSEAKSQSARENGKLGGRPRKNK